ncbi:small nuclear ribonucleoprotein-associated protein B'-like [Bos indicus x Bos taurus]|uniref:small nuclear ribonucleoprotein-associated protein B'-like n=1 Tax=Bos indicus x Bos taurus TaxID=30522 RepID=UPI000F7D0838|nr:small nuclear ribonucleoprotein-associated protein B'-like [Bos indicus x Bos taurus]
MKLGTERAPAAAAAARSVAAVGPDLSPPGRAARPQPLSGLGWSAPGLAPRPPPPARPPASRGGGDAEGAGAAAGGADGGARRPGVRRASRPGCCRLRGGERASGCEREPGAEDARTRILLLCGLGSLAFPPPHSPPALHLFPVCTSQPSLDSVLSLTTGSLPVSKWN